jgi:hypothetical protein
MCVHQKALFNILLPFFIAHTWNSIYQIKRNIIKIPSSKHFGLPPNYAPVHHLQIILKERLNPDAKAVNFTFDNSNIR